MDAIRVLPDAEALVVNYLLAVPEVVAVVDDRIGTELPDAEVYPALVVTRVPSLQAVRRHLDAAEIQVDAWADTRTEASDLARTAHAALLVMVGEFDDGLGGGVVTGVDETNGLGWLPDQATDRPRFFFQMTVYVHPPLGGS